MDDGFLEKALVHDDVTSFHPSMVGGPIDGVSAGFPCQALQAIRSKLHFFK